MTDPVRPHFDSADELAGTLLRAGRQGAPADARRRALVAATTLGAAGLGTGSAMAKGGMLAALKWTGVSGVVGLVGAVTTAVVLHRHLDAHGETPVVVAAPSPVAVPSPLASPPVVERRASSPGAAPMTDPAPEAVAPEAKDPRFVPQGSRAALRGSQGEARASTMGTMRDELATLEQARARIASGDPAGALSVLDGYGVRFPRGSMGTEAAVLRIEALVRAGDGAAAGRAADAFLAAHGDSPYAARVRSLVVGANP